jgi:hypothetical protein
MRPGQTMFRYDSVTVYPQGIDDLRDVIRQIEVSTEDVLFPPTGSDVCDVTTAVLVMVPACLGMTSTSIVAVAPLARLPRSQTWL